MASKAAAPPARCVQCTQAAGPTIALPCGSRIHPACVKCPCPACQPAPPPFDWFGFVCPRDQPFSVKETVGRLGLKVLNAQCAHPHATGVSGGGAPTRVW